jgi:exosortase K
MNWRLPWMRYAQLIGVLCCALILKLHYSTASVNQLRWILAPTTVLVELLTGREFDFELHAGYMSRDHAFLIAGSCAGINFLLTAFLMLSLRRLWKKRTETISWWFIPASGVVAYLGTLVANTVRIATALWLQRAPLKISGLNGNQIHRFEGIFIYFGFLFLLFVLSERWGTRGRFDKAGTLRARSSALLAALRSSLFPLSIYYLTTLGIPLLNGASVLDNSFLEHLMFVLAIPVVLTLIITFLWSATTCRRFGIEKRRQAPALQRAPHSKGVTLVESAGRIPLPISSE